MTFGPRSFFDTSASNLDTLHRMPILVQASYALAEVHKRMHSRMLTLNARNAIMYDKHCLEEYQFLQIQMSNIVSNLTSERYKDQNERSDLD